MKWSSLDVENWYQRQTVKRSYLGEVAAKIASLKSRFEVIPYGALARDPDRYPLYLLKTKNFDPAKRTVLITGGVHGYETSGVHGALEFFRTAASEYEKHFNLVGAPCISPWAYETINRWNASAIDPNRSFRKDSPAEECRLFLAAVEGLLPIAHFDLHETTDTDNSVFRPALQARDGLSEELTPIPDGFYVVGDSDNPKPEFQKAIVAAVAPITHIAPADEQGRLIGEKIEQEGVINYPLKKLSLCAGVFAAEFVTTTEVYPDSPRATPSICIAAQVAAICGGLDYILSTRDSDSRA